MKIYKPYKFRMYPYKEQEELINKTVGSCRFIYNYFLNKKVSIAYSEIKLMLALTEEKTFLKEVDSCVLRNSVFSLVNAYKRYIYRKKYNSIKLDIKNKTITLSKLKEVSIKG